MLFSKAVVESFCVGEPGKCVFIKNILALQVSAEMPSDLVTNSLK